MMLWLGLILREVFGMKTRVICPLLFYCNDSSRGNDWTRLCAVVHIGGSLRENLEGNWREESRADGFEAIMIKAQ